jgi:hypothetical protein
MTPPATNPNRVLDKTQKRQDRAQRDFGRGDCATVQAPRYFLELSDILATKLIKNNHFLVLDNVIPRAALS